MTPDSYDLDLELDFLRRDDDFFFGTLAPFFRASDRPIAIACFRLFTLPPWPDFPRLNVPFFRRCMALLTDLLALLLYFRAIWPSRVVETDYGRHTMRRHDPPRWVVEHTGAGLSRRKEDRMTHRPATSVACC